MVISFAGKTLRRFLFAFPLKVLAPYRPHSHFHTFPYFCAMDNLLLAIESYKKEISNFVAQKSEEAEAFRIKYLGTKGLVKEVMGEMKNVAADKKKGVWANIE